MTKGYLYEQKQYLAARKQSLIKIYLLNVLFGLSLLLCILCNASEVLNCVSCNAGSYLEYRNKTHFFCKQCPNNTTSFDDTNAASPYDCFCKPGFYANAELDRCLPCSPGDYKDTSGNQSCLACPQNSFSVISGASNITECLCERGFTKTGSTCTQCTAGTYKNQISNSSCETCPVHHYCPIGSITPTPCFNNSQSFSASTDSLQCMCNTGYHNEYTWASSLFESVCGPRPSLCDNIITEDGICPIGYCVLEDGITCTADHVEGNSLASIDGMCKTDVIRQCDYNPEQHIYYETEIMKPLFRAHPDIHTGHRWTDINNVQIKTNRKGKQCINDCAADPLCDYAVVQDYASSTRWTSYATDCWHVYCGGDVLNCISPRRNGHWITYEKVSDVCEQIDVTAENCNTSLCEIGDKFCSSCEPGTFNALIDSTSCTNCPQNTYNARENSKSAQDCLPCDHNAASASKSTTQQSCLCNTGYSGSPGSTCIACEKGTFKNTTDEYICRQCPTDTFNDVLGSNSSAACISCPGNSSSQSRSTEIEQCVCDPGFYSQTAIYDCHPCAAGTYQHTANQTACIKCSAGKYSTKLSADTESVCTQCAHGFYSSIEGMTTCQKCQVDTWQPNDAPRDKACQPCVANSTTLGQEGSRSLYSCICDAGFAPRLNATPAYHCIPCPAGNYCPGNNIETPCPVNSFSLEGQTECTVCHDNSYAQRGANPDPSHCICKQGHEGSFHDNCTACPAGSIQPIDFTIFNTSSSAAPDFIVCELCREGKYQTLTAASACVDCPPNALGPPGSEQPTNCYCSERYFGQYESCELCLPGFFCPGGETAQACRPSSHSDSGALSENDCKCVPGFFSYSIGGVCEICEPNKYCVGDQNVSDCPHHSTSLAGSSSEQDCTCEHGNWRGCILSDNNEYVDASGSTCVINYTDACSPCPPNVVCFNETVEHCPDNSYSLAQSADPYDCICLNGFMLHEKHEEHEHTHHHDDNHVEHSDLLNANYTSSHSLHEYEEYMEEHHQEEHHEEEHHEEEHQEATHAH